MTDDFEYRRHWRSMTEWQAIIAFVRCAMGTQFVLWGARLMWPHVSRKTQTTFWVLSERLDIDAEQSGEHRK